MQSDNKPTENIPSSNIPTCDFKNLVQKYLLK